jgi:hypothetical protein
LGKAMDTVRLHAYIDEHHQLSLKVPGSVPPGPVTVWIVPNSEEDDAGRSWMNGVIAEWADDLSDVRQDIYTLDDGQPVHES